MPHQAVTPHGDVLRLVAARRDDLTPALRRIADTIAAHADEVVHMSTAELARRADTSDAAVSRFCRSVEVTGFPELRSLIAVALAQGKEPTPVSLADVRRNSDLATIARAIRNAHVDAVDLTFTRLDFDETALVIDAIGTARQVVGFGVGAAGAVLADLDFKLGQVGVPVTTTTDVHRALALTARAGADTVAIIVSHSGDTRECVEVAQAGVEAGVTVVAITAAAGCTLSKTATHVLRPVAHEPRVGAGGTASRIAQLYVVDLLYLGLLARAPDEETAAADRMNRAVRPHRVSSGEGG
ncbi:MAG TPA: MurR/RpiR family transcriptional regulator [Flexivirga sp.]|uniref:MurR/RpiR family transcriptional regulator n=1 Tax=Flexivirga sp. TaxID=1962927 RepID=UPI002B8AF8FD|nr:MurR/RpiR family transcriptional regulator [Flexivirga sp.]HWC22873.1 MurR/RpiR family transcriptional regulator [Flexivirga sp.]